MESYTTHEIATAFHNRNGTCNHFYSSRYWGVSFDTDAHHVLVYSGNHIGIQCQVDGGARFDLLGSTQFSGTSSRSVYNWLSSQEKELYGEEGTARVNRKSKQEEERN